MPDAREYEIVFEAAETAANAGEFPRAERLLRDGLRLQEEALGPSHPDLASTMNNLAVVCESLGQLDEAERLYRRATSVARAARPADDPLVTTSVANLRDFCAAHGREFEPAVTSRAVPSGPVTPAAPVVAATPPPPALVAARTSAAPTPAATRQSPRPHTPAHPAIATPSTPPRPAMPVPRVGSAAVGASISSSTLALIALVAVVAIAAWMWLGRDAPTDAVHRTASATAQPTADAPATSTPAPAPNAEGTATPAPAPAVPPSPAAVPTRESAAPSPAAPAPATSPSATTGGVRVVVANVCSSLDTSGGAWRCREVDGTAAPGRFAFYTRIASPRGARIRHRWSIDGRVRQDVALNVGASPTEGYRTFSRQTVTPGHWTVALVGADGAVLREAAFDVR